MITEKILPDVGFGTWDVRGDHGKEILKEALAVGYRLIDTAEMYENEDIVGTAVKESGIPRDQIFVTSKISHKCKSAADTKRAVQEALKRMRLDYVDLMLIHEPYSTYGAMYQGLQDAMQEGLVEHIGVSNFNEQQLVSLLKIADEKPAVNQIESHIYYPQLAFSGKLREQGIQMQSWAPFTEGRRDVFHETILLDIGEKHGKSVGQIALRYLVQNGICVIPKSSERNRMEENLDVFDFELDREDIELIQHLDGKRSLFGWYTGQWM